MVSNGAKILDNLFSPNDVLFIRISATKGRRSHGLGVFVVFESPTVLIRVTIPKDPKKLNAKLNP